mmetsp:Transcript_17739/g.33923  ORF Transcript_17739/g.33923 Transcript_17739/m.33923 type:complete len:219 (+) Transcript_17739:281-937(+)|eukprot:CAMPEP_0114238422 /NCGR_PEP_ID=MMETSP0058-20121206/7916_1 /TAXON_ID=36894 /ORGANISM="Pyramimonas parkeae, CCMP726" /LENGTH=218 /DNA_ID=CAMNT_0001350531 /DNA_START=281 /DNA_END=937 /DNA_ORIENTATION=-
MSTAIFKQRTQQRRNSWNPDQPHVTRSELRETRDSLREMLVETSAMLDEDGVSEEHAYILVALESIVRKVLKELYEIHELLATHYLELEDKDPERTAKRAAKRRSVAAHQAVTGKFPPKRRSQQGDEISALAQEFNHGPGEVEDNESNKEWLKVKVKKLEELMYLAATRSRCMGLTAVDLPGVDQPAIVYSPQLSNDEKMELDKYLKQFFRSARIRRE